MSWFDERNFNEEKEVYEPKMTPKYRFPKVGFGILVFFVIAVLVVYLLTGLFTVDPSQVGLVLRFGKHVRTVGPGIHYHLPFPIETVYKVDVLTIAKEEIGFRTIGRKQTGGFTYKSVPKEALMLTKDGNIVHVEAVVQYRIKDPYKYVFKVTDHFKSIRHAAEAILRSQVAKHTVDEVLTSMRDLIANNCMKELQQLLDFYGFGVMIVNFRLQDVRPPKEVAAAFDDVNSAQQDRQRFINEALRYKNSVIPQAQGEASKILAEAEAYKAVRVNAAKGEVARFLNILEEYQKGGQETTKLRLYLESLEKVLPKLKKVIVDESLKNLVPILNVEKNNGILFDEKEGMKR